MNNKRTASKKVTALALYWGYSYNRATDTVTPPTLSHFV